MKHKQLPKHYTTIDEARAWVERARRTDEGCDCPVCDAYCKVYHRPISQPMLERFRDLYQYSRAHGMGDWHHYIDFMQDPVLGRDFAILRHIDLINREGEGVRQSTGRYRMTEFGVRFANGAEAIDETLILYRDMLLGTEGERKTIDALWEGESTWS